MSAPTGTQRLFRRPKESSCCSRCAWVLVHGQQAHLAALAHLAASSHKGGLVRRGKSLKRRNCLLKHTGSLGLRAWGLGILAKCSQGPGHQRHPKVPSISTKPRDCNGNLSSEKVENSIEKSNCSERTENRIIYWLLQVKNRN